jgi:hypothetical protein
MASLRDPPQQINRKGQPTITAQTRPDRIRRLARTLVPLLCLAVMLQVGCAVKVTAPSATGGEYETYSKYGLQIRFPRESAVSETGWLLAGANDHSGIIRIEVPDTYPGSNVCVLEIAWIRKPQIELERELDFGFACMEAKENIGGVERGEVLTAEKAGHRMLYQYYSLASKEGDRAYGIAAVLYCDKDEKLYSFVTVNTGISTEPDLLRNFQEYLSTFVCG